MRSDKKHIVDELEVKNVPLPEETYFLQLKERILQELPEHKAVKIVPLYKRWYFWSGAAATVLVLLTVFKLNYKTPTSSDSIDFSSLSNEEVYQYLHENIEEVEEHELAQHVSIAANWTDTTAREIITVKPRKKSTESSEQLFENIERDEILEYLKNEEISVDELLID